MKTILLALVTCLGGMDGPPKGLSPIWKIPMYEHVSQWRGEAVDKALGNVRRIYSHREDLSQLFRHIQVAIPSKNDTRFFCGPISRCRFEGKIVVQDGNPEAICRRLTLELAEIIRKVENPQTLVYPEDLMIEHVRGCEPLNPMPFHRETKHK